VKKTVTFLCFTTIERCYVNWQNLLLLAFLSFLTDSADGVLIIAVFRKSCETTTKMKSHVFLDFEKKTQKHLYSFTSRLILNTQSP